jgi:hypothetical protein
MNSIWIILSVIGAFSLLFKLYQKSYWHKQAKRQAILETSMIIRKRHLHDNYISNNVLVS